MDWGGRAALLAFAFLGIGSLVYLLYKKDRTEEPYNNYNDPSCTVIEINIPKQSLGLVLGRGGTTLKEIESKSDTNISFADGNELGTYKVCRISGTAEAVECAKALIHEVIVNQPLIENFEMYVPAQACARIIGKNNENIRSISRTSNAKIIVENQNQAQKVPERKIIIKGTSEQIAFAKILIEQKVEEDNDFRNRIETSLASRSPRHKAKYLLPAPGEAEPQEAAEHKEKLVATGSDGLLEVYVSAINDPDKFWVQMMGPSTVALDRLNEEMTEYYSKDENRQLHLLKNVSVGQIVAAPFLDEKWYRAEISDIKTNEYDPEESGLSLYYVDYGDSADYKKKDVYELRSDFLRLRFQAIECILAKVKPRGSWTEEAIDYFEDLTYNALWKSLTARIHSYKERPTRAQREGSPVPCVELYDTQGAGTVNVAEEMVKKGFATWDPEEVKKSKKPEEAGESSSEKQTEEEKGRRKTSKDFSKLRERGYRPSESHITSPPPHSVH